MQPAKPKYSIIIPARNGGKYLPTCVNTIINQDYSDYELIISDDHSTDGSKEYLATLTSHPNISVIEPKQQLSMTEHWEWALSHARGEWLIFVGQDDGLQPYFFSLADRLTDMASKAGVRAIMSERAYFFWEGCNDLYGDIAVSYYARDAFRFLNCRYEVVKALLITQSYFNLPQMYTTSLFHHDLLNEAKQKQQGQLFVTHPQDANLAAISCSLEKKYLMSYIPLGWVGTSPKSAGMAVSSTEKSGNATEDEHNLSALKKEYTEKINKSKLPYHFLAGNFTLGSGSIYFWQSLLQTQNLRKSFSNRIITSKLFKIILFSRVLNNINRSRNSETLLSIFNDLLKRNQFNFNIINLCSKITWLIAGIILLSTLMIHKINGMFSRKISYKVTWSDVESMDMQQASNRVGSLIYQKNWLKKP